MLSAKDFNAAFCANVQNYRQLTGHSQPEMAEILDIANKTYAKYETRTPLPHRYISKFCKVCKIGISDLYKIPESKRAVSRSTGTPSKIDKAA